MSGYRPPSAEPKGKWARAIHAKRRADGISQQGAFEILGPRLGLSPKSRAAYVAIDLGERQPTPREQTILVEWLGAYPAEETAESPGQSVGPGLSELVEYLTAQAVIVNGLLESLVTVSELGEQREVRLRAVEAEVRSLRAQLAGGESPGRPVPAMSGG